MLYAVHTGMRDLNAHTVELLTGIELGDFNILEVCCRDAHPSGPWPEKVKMSEFSHPSFLTYCKLHTLRFSSV
jgi:hypothetical protein